MSQKLPESDRPRPRHLPARRHIALFLAFLSSLFIPWITSGVSFLLALWVILPAPTMLLLPLAVGAPEVSPWLLVMNLVAAGLALVNIPKNGLYWIAVAISVGGILLSSLPLAQLPAANARAEATVQQTLGATYQEAIPPEVRSRFRPAPFVLLDAFRGIPIPQVRRDAGIEFARPDGVPLTLNLYRPLESGVRPTLIVIYGGAWKNGTPANDEGFSRYLAAQGYTVVAIDYRHAPRYRFPAQIEDVRTALSYIQRHAMELEVDLSRVAVMGRSAGAHLAMLASYQPGGFPIRAVVNYYGPVNLAKGYYDLPTPDPINTQAILRSFLGGTPEEFPDLYRQASPITYVTRPLPPSLLVYGGRDHLVMAKFGRALHEQLQATGTRSVWLEIPWAEHAFDAVFHGVSNQLVLYYTERFLASVLYSAEQA